MHCFLRINILSVHCSVTEVASKVESCKAVGFSGVYIRASLHGNKF